MKKSYKKMLIFQFIILIIFSVNSFLRNILTESNEPILLLALLIIFKRVFGLEKDRNRYAKDIIYEIIIFTIIFFIAYYIFGLKIGYARIDNYYSLYGITRFVIPIILTIIIKEIIRYNMLRKTEENKFLTIMTYIVFLCLDITIAIYYNNLKNGNEIFKLIGLTILPAVSSNILYTYMSKTTGYKPVIVYEMIMTLYMYLIPIIPDPNQYLASIINIVLPLILLGRINKLLEKEEDHFEYAKESKEKLIYMIFPVVITVIIVYFTSGYFKYQAIAIASGSMEPSIKKGDVVIIDKNNIKVEEGMVIAYKYNDVIVIHRLVETLETAEGKYHYTKGDNNKDKDEYIVTDDMIIGIVKHKIPYIGYPTVWLSEM